jgi:aliphatic nitrilase
MGDQYPKIRAAAVQAASVFLDRDATVDKACQLIAEAAARGANLIVFPECFIPAHPYWFFLHPAYECRPWMTELFKNAVEVPSPATDRIGRAAREASAYVVMGINERRPGTMGTLYNSQVFFGPTGEILGVHRKIVPTIMERLVHAGGDGSSLRVYPTPFGALGGLVCGENGNPLARYTLLAQGETVHAMSWPAYPTGFSQPSREGAILRSRSAAFEGRVFVVSASGVFDETARASLCRTPEHERMITTAGGVSIICGPAGEILAQADPEKPEIIVADLDLEAIIPLKFNHDITGHYNRFDIFHLQVDRTARAGISFTDGAAAGWQNADAMPELRPAAPTPAPRAESDGLRVVRKSET